MSDTVEPRLNVWGVPLLRRGAAAVSFAPERRFQLLLRLALNGGQWLERDSLAAQLWPDHEPAHARRNLRKVVFAARAVPGAEALEATEHALRWVVATDADASGATAAVPLAAMDEPANPGWTEWLEAERRRLAAARQNAAHARLRSAGEPVERAALARELLEADPLDESAVQASIDAELALGHSAAARRAYDDYARRLADEFGIEPARALRDRLPPVTAMPLASPVSPASPLPAAAAFIGRRTELAELAALLGRAECRRVTLLGPGGVGKSRLAREVLGRVGAMFPGGVHWIELEDLTDMGAVLARLAQRLGIEISDTGDPLPQIARALAASRVLLVLDNAEHLADLAPLAERLAGAAPAATLLVTSRSRVHGTHEWVLPLAGLAVPDEDSRDFDAACSFDAVRLFEQCAGAAQRGFELARHLEAVLDIVGAVDGLPLAIELAASWVRLLPPAEIARELQRSIDLLERDPAAPHEPARPDHVSIQAVLEQSWRLLAPAERETMAALSVFRGGFTRAAARSVTGAAMALLSALVDKSLLTIDASGRFGMHPAIAVFAGQRLAVDAARQRAVRLAHMGHFARHFGAFVAGRCDPGPQLDASVLADYANVLAAWRCAVDSDNTEAMLPLVRVLWPFFERSGRIGEGIAVLRPGLAIGAQGAQATRVLTWLRQGLAMLHAWHGKLHEGLALAEAAVAGGRDCGDAEAWVGSLIHRGTCRFHIGDADAAHADFEQAVAAARACGDRRWIAWALGNLGVSLHTHRADPTAALAMLCEADAIDREIKGNSYHGEHLNNIGAIHRARGDWVRARDCFLEALRLETAHGNRVLVPHLHKNLAQVWRQLGQPFEAAQHLERALNGAREAGLELLELAVERELARLDIAQSRFAEALSRVQSTSRLASAKGLERDRALSVALYGEWLMALDDRAGAARAWRAASAWPALDTPSRREIDQRLASLSDDVPGEALPLAALEAELERRRGAS